ncbi:MAG: LysM peptidoglycan-binding domain-containing protein [Sediminibacterium sp. Gen4]|uniref:lytic transglycosylase n=1 Tax=unclassified Sediminibacterium TaxID=2635961 RepID=UPI0015BC1704|nr:MULTISPECIES: LysM peptidoglycan-binding domain-containing protein [unclassified Sediminibacterium]MBW0162667.1 LysM peptidoglycan-binding domain-containing protein [Sediminibacterium sp.]MBW0165364.1 LysM peptidoglycan-binding domain-containing protein [Sediminibacterium sp.]NWK65153.1 LysM peptidoglycan-binding domain-containing protein [Sediminibacterium sp. Gen4]
MKKGFIFIGMLLLCFCVTAQQKLLLKGKPNAMYIEHKVGEKESLSSIGRIYGITASQLSRFNGRSPSSVLSKGSTLKIPLSVNDISQKTGTPVYHTVVKGDNLFKISQRYNKVPVNQLKTWNKLGAAGVKNGQELVVGYIKTNSDQPSPVSTQKEAVTEKSVESIVTTEAATKSQVSEQVKTVPVKEKESVPVFHNDLDEKNNATLSDEGFFASLYDRDDLTLVQQYRSGDAATFKTISGWTDRKYYVLINDIKPGTIVRITASNNKSICARVLSQLPVTKGDEGLLLRMNNAAASALGIKDEKFTVTLTFFE